MPITTYTLPGNVILKACSVDFNLHMVSPVVRVTQYDDGLAILAVVLYKDGVAYSIPADAIAKLRWGNGRTSSVIADAIGCNVSRDTIYFKITKQMTLSYGTIYPTIEVSSPSGDTLNTASMSMVIERNPIQDGEVTFDQNGAYGSLVPMISITYADLKVLRDNSKLVPGQQYRITDYVATTSQADTKSASHPFDIIVIANSTSVLNENAKAIQHDGDTYFTNSKLASWELKYCLDNNTNRFGWASSSGKGVIYFMRDEWDNEAPYDFKNIQFKRYKVTNKVNYAILASLSGKYLGFLAGEAGLTNNLTDFVWCYTFNTNDWQDRSTKQQYILGESSDYSICNNNYCCHNIIKENAVTVSIDSTSFKVVLSLNNIVLQSEYWEYSETPNVIYKELYNNLFCVGNHDITILDNADNNTFGSDCCQIVSFGMYQCTFKTKCSNNSFGCGCNQNTFGRYYGSNTFGNYCQSNTFGSYCQSNTFGDSCNSNTFGNGCNSNTFGNDFYSNTFGNYCQSNTFGNYCQSNTFGSYCQSNTFGNYCQSNTFGNCCKSNTFGTSCYNNTFNVNYCEKNIFDNGVSYINLTSADTPADSTHLLQNVHVHQGVKGASGAIKTITVTRSRAYQTNVVTANDVTVTA